MEKVIVLPSGKMIGAAIAVEIGRAGGEKMFDNYPDNFNEALNKIGDGIYNWLKEEVKIKRS